MVKYSAGLGGECLRTSRKFAAEAGGCPVVVITGTARAGPGRHGH